ncbi:hypothetical protein [Sinorhizobium mexicanum]|uniref:Uncharacterized protein n=1 Tax=Sinorhizobium mexicanum TaxID=375549 RepID=A0A859QYZ4_9HYPH|nr:hypothetical protein [Sinorhizobium mexicanum]MBP1888286.1 hypothetical protein [Sinorhizobium mexicanum]QLL64081.1 hypothetical protein FKV68_21750 [Sinorhizobium mexicanum]
MLPGEQAARLISWSCHRWVADTFIDAASPVHNPDHAHLRFVEISFLRVSSATARRYSSIAHDVLAAGEAGAEDLILRKIGQAQVTGTALRIHCSFTA